MTVNASHSPFKVPTHMPTRTPGKRTQSSSIASSPCPWTSTSHTNSDMWPAPGESTCSTPYTPYPSQPSDSPTNPFGRKRTERLLHTLPAVTSFGKHVPLRFQVVRTGRPSLSPKMGGVHRIAQVPLNYTFSHLRCLIHWLFEPSLGNLALTSSQTWKRHNIPPTAVDERGNITPWQDEDYLFEVKSDAIMFSQLYKPGEIKQGKTVVKLSNVRDPGSWKARFGWQMEEESDNEDELADDNERLDPPKEEGDWRWEDEQDYTLSHVWSKGLSLETGIVYNHDHRTQVHITVNNTPLPKRRGHGNTPYIFTARGRLCLSPRTRPLPRPRFSSSVLGSSPPRPGKAGWFSSPLKSTGKKRALRGSASPPGSPSPRKRAKREGSQALEVQPAPVVLAPDSDAEESSDEELPSATQEIDDPSAALNIESWNDPPHAFGIYLVSRLGLPPSLRIRPSGSNMSLHSMYESSRQSEDGPSVHSTHNVDNAEEVDEEDILDGSFFSEKETYDPFANDDADDDESTKKKKKRKSSPVVKGSKEGKSSPLPPSSPPKSSPGHPKFQTIESEGDDADNEDDAEGEEYQEGDEEDIEEQRDEEEEDEAEEEDEEAAEEQSEEENANEEDLDDTWEEDENDLGNVSSATLPCLVSDDECTETISESMPTSSKSLIFPSSHPLSPRSLSSYHAHIRTHHIGYDPSKLPAETPFPQAAYAMSKSNVGQSVSLTSAPIAPLLSASTLNSKSRENLRAAARAQLLKMDRVEKRIDGMKKHGYMKERDLEIQELEKGDLSKATWNEKMIYGKKKREREAAEEEVDQLDEGYKPHNVEDDDWDPFGDEPEI
ncbi:hypothetical protein BJ165DRAFT_1487946 [Panaeolus papilionaceus]|nr:hypothetical protein BJ165DRAFT_1487946 [Panaeolus papilionaceus]